MAKKLEDLTTWLAVLAEHSCVYSEVLKARQTGSNRVGMRMLAGFLVGEDTYFANGEGYTRVIPTTHGPLLDVSRSNEHHWYHGYPMTFEAVGGRLLVPQAGFSEKRKKQLLSEGIYPTQMQVTPLATHSYFRTGRHRQDFYFYEPDTPLADHLTAWELVNEAPSEKGGSEHHHTA